MAATKSRPTRKPPALIRGMHSTRAEDAKDSGAFDKRAKEPRLDFETLVGSLRKRGKI